LISGFTLMGKYELSSSLGWNSFFPGVSQISLSSSRLMYLTTFF
jgi:hypothetical protein